MSFSSVCAFITLSLAALPNSVFACAACYGQSDSAMAKGMNWGILSLLGVVVSVLGGIASFFFVMARRTTTPPENSGFPISQSQLPVTDDTHE